MKMTAWCVNHGFACVFTVKQSCARSLDGRPIAYRGVKSTHCSKTQMKLHFLGKDTLCQYACIRHFIARYLQLLSTEKKSNGPFRNTVYSKPQTSIIYGNFLTGIYKDRWCWTFTFSHILFTLSILHAMLKLFKSVLALSVNSYITHW